jgi:hypothetical protein
MYMWRNRGTGLYGPRGQNSPSWRPGWQLKSKLESKLGNKVQAGTIQVADRCMKNIVYRNTMALETTIIRNAGAATRLCNIR